MSEGLLQGQVAVVSGGLGDIGRAIALELARQGASVGVADLPNEKAAEQALLAGLREQGRQARYDCVDVSDPEAVRRWLAVVASDLGLPTIVVSSAATVTQSDLRNMTAQQWRHELAVNLDGAFYLAQEAAQRMIAAKRPGRIIFLGSWAAHAPHVAVPAYSVSKAGLRMLCRCLARELAPLGILVNEVAPGYVDAGVSAQLFRADSSLRTSSQRRVPTQRLIEPADVAVEVARLCDPRVSHYVGATMIMDGGLSLGCA